METVNIISIISIAFLGSFGHCIGMCGGIVLAYSTIKIEPKSSKVSQSAAHLLYSFGRVFTYSILGAVFGTLGGVVTFNNTANGMLLIVAGIAMVLAGLSLMGKIKFLTLIEHSFSSSSMYKNAFKNILNSKSNFSFFVLGMLNGLLPCGFVYFFAITAASTASPLYGALVMAIFGISTIPAMFGLGFLTSLSSATSFRNMMMSLSSFAVIIYGSYTIYNGYDYIARAEKTLTECHTK
ncbi:MAG: beta-carotene 15,15'-monooxygenase [Sulfurimonas sp. RIFOXYD12_FULL_33_39]|uniref:sulfite exporter TauE/SafE family protein n=1 Tax=unclassified Sulfurimonas TaxID=2623549 RepID=UPI0008BFD264|nr:MULTISPECIES: sulfite exporter TauE/SafE family protein [unclassified Sulfurimonas]OHE05514.1 MAG: beta-carotene 15,15'-monooxygenase [Sulfurimonas sp. RIFCSPLOWO2_12_FULL_34_6]OHE09261.1 MAG: beta-carotene 15,15'-monooxygenase [Sulfurimonas sp. RIFOXYD12_FULL_33_39]OHE12956.1 MAG: beta-carotene 15,15'-monooxygenase [Sulfurimonas sp. RIFOXYD2_FULL_34_21]DAB27831.1 MAG TPA: beta-carotene 15,15'-monooxygenase [Sulfurimonas sp. UBA10385]